MASGGKKKKYTADTRVNEWLLNQVVKCVNHDEIESFATDLFVEESVYSNTPGSKDKALKVRDLWMSGLCTVTYLGQRTKH